MTKPQRRSARYFFCCSVSFIIYLSNPRFLVFPCPRCRSRRRSTPNSDRSACYKMSIMAPVCFQHFVVLFILVLIRFSCAETVSIWEELSDDTIIPCIRTCLFDTVSTKDVGSTLGCQIPYENDCYCAAATAPVTAIDELFASCATSFCSIYSAWIGSENMTDTYSSYCSKNGFLPDITTTSEVLTTSTTGTEEPGQASRSGKLFPL